MKIISLNTWGGLAGKEQLLAFFKKYQDIDVFCLQEIWSAPYEITAGYKIGGKDPHGLNIMVYGLQEISELLDNHAYYFRPHHLENYGLLMLVKRDLQIVSEGEVFVHKEKGYIPKEDVGHHARNLQFITIATKNGDRSVLNFHGLWNGQGKGDSEDRLAQSDKIIQFIKTLPNPFVLCGDFNLRPDTESLKKLEDIGLRNLIKEHHITSTRTSFYKKPEKFADYALVSRDIEVKDFKVLPDEVSDHNALYLEFE